MMISLTFAGRWCLAALVWWPLAALAASPPVLVPAPREVQWATAEPLVLEPASVAIVLGRAAVAPEEEGARLLSEFVTKHFRQTWPIIREGEETPAQRTLVVIGQRGTNRMLDQACRANGIELSEKAPGHDGYIIHPVLAGARQLLLVGGSNARGAMYGQDTLVQMLRRDGEKLTFIPGTVRDAPVVPWRGRPQTMVRHYLRPGELDLYAISRVNFIDLRSGIYAFEPGEKLNPAEIRAAVNQAHRLGFVVFATVNCGVPRADYGKVMGTFRELLDLGADGLWLSFDDKGPGEDPVWLTQEVLELGRQRGITGRRIATTPPKGSYPKIRTEFNRKIMAIPGMEEALWFWTAIPAAERLAEARELGAKVKPSWWHNWPRLFTAQKYVGIPPLSLGWSQPEYPALVSAGEHVEAVMPWGGNAHGQHYVVPVINWWAWNPAGHDWNAVRQRVQRLVFGEAQVDPALSFDDQLQELFGLFRYSHKATNGLPPSPPRLRDRSTATLARRLIADLRANLDKIASPARAANLLVPGSLETDYLKPMLDAVEIHARAIELRYPEEWWPAVQREILAAVHSGDDAAVKRIAQPAGQRVRAELEQIQQALPDFPRVDVYAEWWKSRGALDPAGWRALLKAHEAELAERVHDYGTRVESLTMIGALREPPLEWGIGRWQVSNRLLATVLPKAQPLFWGDWLAGIHREAGLEAAVFAAHRKVPGELGEYAELPMNLPLSGQRDRLALLLFISSTNKDLFSNTMIPYRWAGYRFIQILRDEQVLWERDLGAVPESGEWCMVRLPPVPAEFSTLNLSVRVEDRRVSLNNYTISYFGPVRLIELPE